MKLVEFLGETKEQRRRTVRLVLTGILIAVGLGGGLAAANGDLEKALANITSRPPATRSGGFTPGYNHQEPTPVYPMK